MWSTSPNCAPLDTFTDTGPTQGIEAIMHSVALGNLVVLTGASTADRLGASVAAVPVLDGPLGGLHLAWLPGDLPVQATTSCR